MHMCVYAHKSKVCHSLLLGGERVCVVYISFTFDGHCKDREDMDSVECST